MVEDGEQDIGEGNAVEKDGRLVVGDSRTFSF
jgi:hypothetical protein